MPQQRPSIGISVAHSNHPAYQVFAEAVFVCGGEPVLLTPETTVQECAHLPGFILTGGGDIHPTLYGDGERAPLRYYSAERDRFELALCEQHMSRPILGVCRGIQIMAVASRGKLIQHISDEVPGALVHDAPSAEESPGHLIAIRAGTKLADLLGAGEQFVNTSHHQAISTVGGSQIVSAQSPDGVIEAIEQPARPFFLGVQWHPERMWQSAPKQRRLIEGLIAAVRASQ